jgi:hypothetical protein
MAGRLRVNEMADLPRKRIEDATMNTSTTAELLAALGSAFAATLLGVAVRDLDVMPVLGDRLLEELHKRGFAVYRQTEEPSSES